MRPFGRLLTSYTVNEIGDSVGIVALALLVYDRTHGIAQTAALFIAAKFVPALIAPAITARVDQLPLRRTLPMLYVAEAGVFAALALLATGDDLLLGAVLALALVDGTLALTGRSLTRGAVAALLQPANVLREGNALMNIGFAVASVGGAALAGVLVGATSLSTALFVDAASFLIIAVLLAATSGLPSVEVARQPFAERFRAGLEYARRDRLLRFLLGGEAIALVLFTLVVPVEVIYARESIHTDSAGYGVLLASWGAGIVVGSLLYLRVKNRPAWTLIIASTFAIGVGYIGLALAQTLAVACAVSIIGGAGNGIQWIAVMTALQEKTPMDYQARITGLMESLGAAMPGVGYLLGALIVTLADPRTAFAVAGCGVMVLVLFALPLRARFDRPDPPSLNGGNGHPARAPEHRATVQIVQTTPPDD